MYGVAAYDAIRQGLIDEAKECRDPIFGLQFTEPGNFDSPDNFEEKPYPTSKAPIVLPIALTIETVLRISPRSASPLTPQMTRPSPAISRSFAI